jgi:hypothetical protein
MNGQVPKRKSRIGPTTALAALEPAPSTPVQAGDWLDRFEATVGTWLKAKLTAGERTQAMRTKALLIALVGVLIVGLILFIPALRAWLGAHGWGGEL